MLLHHDDTAVAIINGMRPFIDTLGAVDDTILLLQVFLFSPASLPTTPPFTDEKLEAIRIDADARLKANAEIAVAHLIRRVVVMEQTKMACDGE